MTLSKEAALEILGLPSFASNDFIVQRYKYLALEWFPEKHDNSEFSVEVFGNITRAALTLLQPGKSQIIDLEEMYNFFQHVFFGGAGRHDKEVTADCECEQEVSDSSANPFEDEFRRIIEKEEIKAAGRATELILEEEEEKAKSERRKAKKKRRKERKKLEKVEPKSKAEESVQNKQSNDAPKKKAKKGEILKVSDSEEDLDPSSAFVSVVAKKHRKQIPGLQLKQDIVLDINNHYSPDLPSDNEEDPEIIILKSRQIALEGNAKANEGRYSEAVELFSESIKLDPSDHRFYGNRSYCYDRLGMFDKALKDAEKSIKLCPVWPKGYFRKGRALLGQKKYAAAEKFFVEVLKLDNDCEDAISELRKAKLLQIMEKGFTKEVAEESLSRHGSVAEALASLLSSGVSRIQVRDDLDIFISDDEIENIDKTPPKPKPKPPAPHLTPSATQSPYYDIKRDPKNPEGHNSIWIGNVQPDVTEKKLTTMFGKYGELISVKAIPEKFCAFVNYKSKASPGKAMQALQGYELSGYNLVIRFPNLPGETAAPAAPTAVKKKPGVIGQEVKKMGPVNGNECYFWRTTGCVYGEVCRYKHIKEHKGIDKKGWQVT